MAELIIGERLLLPRWAETQLIRAGIVGGTGYTGVELIRLLLGHPGVDLVAVTSRGEAGTALADLFPNLRGCTDLAFTVPDVTALSACDVVFFATPNAVAMTMARELLDGGTRIIDLSADFRIRDPEVWTRWYGQAHACPELLDTAVYGLTEVVRDKLPAARLVANPGCYPTAVQLGFLPLLEAGLVDPANLIADTKSGASGAGRQARLDLQICEASESVRAYGVPGHRHHPEIEQGLARFATGPVGLVFVPHLMPMVRGIHATLYADLLDEREHDLQTVFEDRYAGEPFVDVLPSGSHPETRSVRGINTCRIAVHRPGDGRRVVVLAVIDNLVKGAAGQALQNMNLMFGLDETAGLGQAAVLP